MRSATAGRWRVTGAAALCLGLVVAACSSTGDPVAPTPTAPSTPGSGSLPSGTDPRQPGDRGLVLRSSAFADGSSIPTRYACTNQGGEAASPPLEWTGVPDGAANLVLVVHDPDAPRPGGFTHLVTVIPPDTTEVADGANATGAGPMAAWIGPCPPSGEHHYQFTLYAFGSDVILPEPLDKAAVDAVAPDALATAELTGLFATR